VAAQLRSCVDWAEQASVALGRYAHSVNALASSLEAEALRSGNLEFRQTAASLMSAAHNLEALVSHLRATRHHGTNHLRAITGR